jgi:hypothetical protein
MSIHKASIAFVLLLLAGLLTGFSFCCIERAAVLLTVGVCVGFYMSIGNGRSVDSCADGMFRSFLLIVIGAGLALSSGRFEALVLFCAASIALASTVLARQCSSASSS